MSDDPADRPVFTHGVASFDPGPDRVLLWTRVEGATHVTWHVRPADDHTTGTTRSGVVPVDAAHGCVTVEVDGLEPGADLRYWFSARNARSTEGRTRTLPVGSPGSWRLGVLCCADHSINHLTVHRRLAEADVDLVVHLGDYIYENRGKGGRKMEPDRTCVTVEDYHRRYAQVRRDPATLALHARHPMVFVWDDHDVADNAWRGGAKAHDPDEHGPWGERLRAAAVARERWLPARLADPDDLLRTWRSLRAGDLAELVLLDTRIDGRDQQAGDPGAPPLHAPDRAMLGPAQRRWLEERLRDRSSRWCLLGSQVTVSPMRLPVGRSVEVLRGAPSGYGIVDGDAVCTDEWDGYPAERRRVARWLADRGGDAVILSGDVHSAWVFDGPLSPGVPAVAPEFVCPAVSSTPMARQLPRGWQRLASRLVEAAAPGPRWFDLEWWGFLTVEVTPEVVRAAFHRVDARDPDAPARRSSEWAVRRDPPRVERTDTSGDDALRRRRGFRWGR
jgi:alkaline phosphatase D